MGSMGSVVGEKLTCRSKGDPSATAADYRLRFGRRSPHARRYALAHADGQGLRGPGPIYTAGGLFISVLTHPTMGGVAASFASLGDVIFAEPKALIGFAGPRTIKATIRIELPDGSRPANFLNTASSTASCPPRPAKHDHAAH